MVELVDGLIAVILKNVNSSSTNQLNGLEQTLKVSILNRVIWNEINAQSNRVQFTLCAKLKPIGSMPISTMNASLLLIQR